MSVYRLGMAAHAFKTSTLWGRGEKKKTPSTREAEAGNSEFKIKMD